MIWNGIGCMKDQAALIELVDLPQRTYITQ